MADYVVNWAGIRYDHTGGDSAWANLQPGTVLYVQNNGLSNASGTGIKETGREQYIKEQELPPPLPTETELNLTSGTKVLFVGMRPTSATEHTKVTTKDKYNNGQGPNEGKKRKSNKGQSVLSQQDGHIVSHDRAATRVVVPFGKQNINYYVLLAPNSSGIYKGLSCEGDEVFFFKEFRDDVAATSLSKRKIATGKLIRAAAGIQIKQAPRKIDTTIAQITEAGFSYDEMIALVSTYLVGGGPALLQHNKKLLKSKADDNGERYSHLAVLLRGDEAINGMRAEQVKLDIETTWPPLQALDITSGELAALSQGITLNGLTVSFRYARAFVVAAIQQLRKEPGGFHTQVASVLDNCKLQIGTDTAPGARVDVSDVAPLRVLLDALMQEVQGIRNMNQKQMETMKNFSGAHLKGDALETILARLATVLDLDGARLDVSQLFRSLISIIGALGSGVDERLEALEKMLRSLRDDVEEDLA